MKSIKTKTKTKKPLFYLDNIFNNLLIFNTVQTKNTQNDTQYYTKQTVKNGKN